MKTRKKNSPRSDKKQVFLFSKNKLRLWLGLALIVMTCVLFSNVLGNDFVNYDDPTYVTQNNQIQDGFSVEGIRWAFTTTYAANWHPLTWLSHMLDVELFGVRPWGHHLTSVLLHVINTVLLFFVLCKMTDKTWQSFLVAVLFAIHPLHVESVAWVAERKDVLSTMFWFLTVVAYLRYVNQPKTFRYMTIVLIFALGLMAKPMLVTLPLILLLLDYWPLRRWGGEDSSIVTGKKLLIEKIPLFFLSGISGILTLIAQKNGGAVGYSIEYPTTARVANAFNSYAAYLLKTAWPGKLSVFYPNLWGRMPWWQPLLGGFFLLGITAWTLWGIRRRPAYFVGWAWYVLTLLPVIGIIQIGSQAMADRYTYVPLTGVFVIIAWGFFSIIERWPNWKAIGLVLTGIVVIFFMTMTWKQTLYWRNSQTLFEQALRVEPDNYIAHANLGSALAAQGRTDEARVHIAKSFQLNPLYRADVHYRSGQKLAERGMVREAIAAYRKALEIIPYDKRYQAELEKLQWLQQQQSDDI